MGNVTEVCKGRWQGLLPLFGIDSRYLSGRHGPCPLCGGKDRWRFDDRDGRGTWFCNNCGSGDGLALLMRLKSVDFLAAQELVRPLIGQVDIVVSRQERGQKSLEAARERLWRLAEMISRDDLVSHYLERRGIVPVTFPSDLRHLEKCQYGTSDKPQWFPAMLARVTGPDGHPSQLHRTYLDSVGNKAKVKEPRKLMPGRMVKGSAVRLMPFEAGRPLGIAEGIETALAAAQLFQMPVWSALNAAMLMEWQPPAEAGEIIVFGDNDASFEGQTCAFALARRLRRQRDAPTVEVMVPKKPGSDWNDALLEV